MNIELLLYLLIFCTGIFVGITFLILIQGATYKDYEKKE